MKYINYLNLTYLFIILNLKVFSQGIGINYDGIAPDSSSILDLKSSSKGFLIPRMTQTERNAIFSPALGLIIYQIDGIPGFYHFENSWKMSNTQWITFGNNIYFSSGNVGIGSDSPKDKLQIGNRLTFSNGTTPENWHLSNNCYVDGLNWKYILNGNANQICIDDNGDFRFKAANIGSANNPISWNIESLIIKQNGNLGIGTTIPNSKLQIANGDLYIQTQSNGIILRDTDGSGCHRITINSAGTITSTAVPCP